jgi:tRNA(Ile)-lysidine synthase
VRTTRAPGRSSASSPRLAPATSASIALEAEDIDHDAVHLEAIDALVAGASRGELALDLPGARVVRTYDRLDIVRPQASPPPVLVAPAGPYVLRVWQPGDRMKPARLKGRSRKLSDLYADAKIPRALRATARVVVRTFDANVAREGESESESETIVWAEHLGLAFDAPASAIPEPRAPRRD